MKRLVLLAIFICCALCSALSAPANVSVAAAAADAAAETGDAAAQADRAFVQAAGKQDSAQLGRLLDADFTWTNAAGETRTRAEVLASVPRPVMGEESAAKTDERDYGQVVAILSGRERIHVLRVWAKHGSNWQLLVYHEVSQMQEAKPSPGTGVKECENPCKTVPFQAKNEAEQGVIASWQALETGVTNHDAQAWSQHVDQMFITISSNSDHPVFKADRMAMLDSQKESGYGSAPAPLVSARMFDFADTVVMTCLHQPHKGKPIRVSRVWIKRNGKWVMAISFQTTIEAAAANS